jgi:exopolysaccharide production protein ExoQ
LLGVKPDDNGIQSILPWSIPMSATLAAAPVTSTTTYGKASDPLLFRRVQTWWLLLGLFLVAQGNGILSVQGKHESLKVLKKITEGSGGFLLVLTVLMSAICVGMIVTHLGPTVRLMQRQKAVLAFALLAFISTVWSQVPGLTFRKATLLFLMIAFGWFFAASYPPADQMRLLLALGVIMALMSIAWVIILPNYGISEDGEWKGVFGQKNFLGSTMFYLFSGLLFSRIACRRRLLMVSLQAIVAIGLILLSRSRTPLLMAVILVAVRVVGPLLPRLRREAIPFALYCLVLALAMIPMTLGIVLPLIGRDLTFTGRTHEWAVIFPFALKHLWLGYGYEGFWTGTSGDSGSVLATLGAGLGMADSGYLDLMLQFGLLGLGLLLVLLIACARDYLTLLRRPPVPLLAHWYAGLVLATFAGGVTEGMFWMPIRIVPFMLVIACAGLRNISIGLRPYR